MTSIQASVRQSSNPILKHIRRVKVEVCASSVPELDFFDFIVNSQLRIPILYLQLKFHAQYKDYIGSRIQHVCSLPPFSSQPPVLIMLVDIDDPSAIEELLEQVTNACVLNGVRLLLAWASEEAARILEILHVFGPDRAGDIARGVFSTAGSSGNEEQLAAQAKEAIVTVQSGVGPKDATTLLSHFKSMKNLILASTEQLSDCPSIGVKKSAHINNVFSISWTN